jgi:orotate phosphoribosyltransferase
LILDDVITAGTAIKETVSIIREAGGIPSSIIVALDREEVGNSGHMPAVQELEAELSVPIRSVVSLGDLVNYLKAGSEFSEYLPAVQAYQKRYGPTT